MPIVHHRLRRLANGGGFAAALLLLSCGSRASGAFDAWSTAGCARHDQCDASEICQAGTCAPGDRDAPLQLDDAVAQARFENPDGSCTGAHRACGPWICVAGACVDPIAEGYDAPMVGEIAYWDGACGGSADCGPWVCGTDGWCRPAELSAELGGYDDAYDEAYDDEYDDEYDEFSLESLWAEDEYGSFGSGGLGLRGSGNGGGGDMVGIGTGAFGPVYPPDPSLFPEGYLFDGEGNTQICEASAACQNGRACLPEHGVCAGPPVDTPMVTAAIPASRWFRHTDGTCVNDTDCAAWACDGDQCVPAEQIGLVPPPYRAIRFNDFSCITSDDCGGWTCASGFCHDPARVR